MHCRMWSKRHAISFATTSCVAGRGIGSFFEASPEHVTMDGEDLESGIRCIRDSHQAECAASEEWAAVRAARVASGRFRVLLAG